MTIAATKPRPEGTVVEIADPSFDVLDRVLSKVARESRLLPALVLENAALERARLVDVLSRGGHPVPEANVRPRRVDPRVFRAVDAARDLAPPCELGALYRARFDELELDLALLEALGDGKRVRPIAARRFGTGSMRVHEIDGAPPLSELARRILTTLDAEGEPRTLPAECAEGPSLAGLVRTLAAAAGLEVTVRVDARLSALAATGDRLVVIADRRFGAIEARRLAVHEVLGHLVASANAREQKRELFVSGMAGSFGDQEGVALHLEEESGLLDAPRLRTLAARVVATDAMHMGASFGECARWLHRDHGFSAADAIGTTERAYRGGGVARDVAYLSGFVRVREAIGHGRVSLSEMRMGRVSVSGVLATRDLGRVHVRVPSCDPLTSKMLPSIGVVPRRRRLIDAVL